MSYNVRYDTDGDADADGNGDGEHAWSRRRDRVVETISTAEPDLVGLQEPLSHQLNYLEATLPAYTFVGVGREDGKREGEFVPIGYLTDRFALADQGAFWLSATPDEPGSVSWNAVCPRVTTWITLESEDVSLTVFNTHFDHRSALARHRSAEALRSKIASATVPGPIIVTADLNCSESTSAYEVLVGPGDDDSEPVLRDGLAVAESEPRGPRRTYHQFTAIPLERRDYVFVGPSTAVTSYRTIDEREREHLSSDHFPIVAEVSLESTAARFR